ncbi:MAG: lipopolysaccharide kinase InaA family protein, partial [Thermodesulfobacteriota bacterium]
MKGWIREEVFNLLPFSFFEDPFSFVQQSSGEIIKDSRHRWAGIFTLPSHKKIFLKGDKTKGWLEALKYSFLPSKGRKEWFIAHQLQKKGLSIPKPFGWMERVHRRWIQESYYLSEAVGSGGSLIDLLKSKENIPIESLAKAVRRFHDAGVFHKDLHAGNFLWSGEDFFLTDLHRAKILPSLPLEKRLWNLAQWFHSLRSIWEEMEFLLFLRKYFGEKSMDPQSEKVMFQRILSMMLHLQRRQFKSRTKRCLKESSEFSVNKEDNIFYYHRREFPLDLLKNKIEEHLNISKQKSDVLVKEESGVTISILKGNGHGVILKEFRPVSFWSRFKELFRYSKAMKAWVNGNGLIVRGMATLKPLGVAEERGSLGLRQSFFLMEALGEGQELDRYLFNEFQNILGKRLFVKTFARWVAHLHKMSIYHRDMKACNILVSKNEGSWNFHLLDLEDVRLDRKVKEKELFKNFLQLNTSIPRTVTKTDRLRFLKNYFWFNPVMEYNKEWILRLIQKSKERGVVYVTPHGVVE